MDKTLGVLSTEDKDVNEIVSVLSTEDKDGVDEILGVFSTENKGVDEILVCCLLKIRCGSNTGVLSPEDKVWMKYCPPPMTKGSMGQIVIFKILNKL